MKESICAARKERNSDCINEKINDLIPFLTLSVSLRLMILNENKNKTHSTMKSYKHEQRSQQSWALDRRIVNTDKLLNII